MTRGQKRPLYRKVNTKARGVNHHVGGDFRHERNSKRFDRSDATRGPMHGRDDRGLDYTPLFRFLLASVGNNWDEIFQEAVARLDKADPIYWLVARRDEEQQEIVRIGESSYYSGLFVDESGRLQLVNPRVTVEQLRPSCACCTHTFNGIRFTRKF